MIDGKKIGLVCGLVGLLGELLSLAGHAAAEPLSKASLIRFKPPWTSPFRVDPAFPYHFVNDEGERLFVLNKTAWLYFACKDPEGVCRRARAIGASVIRVALEGRLYYDVLGIDLWPWGGTRENPQWTKFNDRYWQEVEKRVRLAGEHGLGLDLVLYTSLHPTKEEIAKQKPYWERIIERLGKYANIFCWEIANEYTENEEFQDAAGEFFRRHDPFARPVCTSAGTTDDAVWPHKPWMTLAINHSCTSSTPVHDLEHWYLAVARNVRSHGKPAFCNESGREKRHRNDDGTHRRKQAWLWCTAGCFWTWHSWDGCEGINDLTYRAPGEEFLKPLVDFYCQLPFWKLSPNFTACTVNKPGLVSATLATPDRDVVITYLCTRESGAQVSGAQLDLRLPAGQYELTFVDPPTGRELARATFASRTLAQTGKVTLPDFRDDLVILVRLTARGRQGAIPGTE